MVRASRIPSPLERVRSGRCLLARQVSWPRILAEGAAIVVSILLAFGIQAWWDTARDRDEEQQILAGLELDMATNLAELDNVIAVHLQDQKLLAELDAMTRSEAQAFSPDSAGAYTVALGAAYTFDSQDGTLEGVLASGTLQLIRSAAVRENLVAWRRGLSDTVEEADAFRRVSERALERVATLGGPFGSTYGPVAAVPELREAYLTLPQPNLAALVSDDALLAIARHKRIISLGYLRALIQLKAQGEVTLRLVREAGDAF